MSSLEKFLRAIWIPLISIYYLIESFIKFVVPNKYLKVKSIHENDIILITGAGMGLGQQTAIKFVENGCRQLIIWDVNDGAMKETAKIIESMGCKVWTFNVDVTDYDCVMKTAEEIKSSIGNVSYLVNNAGIVAGKPILQLQAEKIKKVIDVNLVSHFWTIQAFLPGMLRHGGHIVTISSVVGQIPAPYLSEYVASKFGAYGLHSSLRAELKVLPNGSNVETTCICPWAIATGMFDGVDTGDIFPHLETKVAAQAVVDAVLANREQLIIPSGVRLMPIIRHLLPEKLVDLIFNLLTNVDAGKNLAGRQKDN